MTQQELRNALSAIEDDLRHMRNTSNIHERRETRLLNILVSFTQIIREEMIK